MNKRVFTSMLVLCMIFLVAMYFLKIFFPEEFMFRIQNERIIQIGAYIDETPGLYYLICGLTAFLTYLLYCLAACGRVRLKWFEYFMIIAVVGSVRLFSFIDDRIAIVIEDSAFFVLPWLFRGKLSNTAITFTVHGFSQMLSLSIRDLTVYLTDVNFLTIFLMTFECYLWLVLLTIIFNYESKKKEV